MTNTITPRGAVRIHNRAVKATKEWHDWCHGYAWELLGGAGPSLAYRWQDTPKIEKELDIAAMDRAIDRLTQIRNGLAQSIEGE